MKSYFLPSQTRDKLSQAQRNMEPVATIRERWHRSEYEVRKKLL